MALSEVGVEAVVKGLGAFQSDLGKMNSSLQGLRGEGTLLQRAFGSVTEGILNFGAHVARVAEVALGVLLRDAIRAAVDFVKELVSATIDAGNEFQVLEIRLERLNFNTLIESGVEYNKAAAEAIQLTQEQLKWLQLLAAKSPYDAQDVANTFTLARSYGFAADEAQSLTSDILNFAAGMGLGNTEIQRIIVNFGQMVQQGKVTQREMNDLARGAFVPVNDVLSEMQKELGLTDDEFTKFKSSTEGVNAFLGAFSNLVEKRFAGATEKMSETFKAGTDNVLDLVKGIFGLNAVEPVLDVLGKRAAAFANSFTDNPEKWDKLVAAASRLGEALSSVVSGLFDLLPGTGDLTDKVIELVNKAAQWVEDNRENIIGFFKDLGDFIVNQLIPFLGKAADFLVNDFGPAVYKVFQWILENKDTILKWVIVLGTAFLAWQAYVTIILAIGNALFSVLGAVLGFAAAIIGILGFINSLNLVIAVAGPVIAAIAGVIGSIIAIAAPILLIIGTLTLLYFAFKNNWGGITTTVQQAWFLIKYFFDQMLIAAYNFGKQIGEFLRNKFLEIKQSIINIDWIGLGRSVVQGIANGISSFAGTIVNAARNAAMSAYNAAISALGIHSPSKLFFEIGAETMQGMALGIQKSAGLAAMTMQSAMAQVASSTMPSVTNSNVYNNTANYNLTVNSSAPTEPVMQDFAMMQSLAGV